MCLPLDLPLKGYTLEPQYYILFMSMCTKLVHSYLVVYNKYSDNITDATL